MAYNSQDIILLIRQLNNADPSTVSMSILCLPDIMKSLGKQRTLYELFPFIAHSTSFSESNWDIFFDVLVNLKFEEYNIKDFQAIFSFLESISNIKLKSLKLKMVNVTSNVLSNFPRSSDFIQKIFIPFINHLFSSNEINKEIVALYCYADNIQLLSGTDRSEIFMKIVEILSKKIPSFSSTFLEITPKIYPHLRGAVLTKMIQLLPQIIDIGESSAAFLPGFLIEYAKNVKNLEKVRDLGNQLLKSDFWRIRCSYITNLDKIFPASTGMSFEDAYEIISQAAEDKDKEVQIAAAQQLSYISSFKDINAQEIQKLIETFLSMSEPLILISVISSLPAYRSILGDEFVINNLKKIMTSKNPRVNIAAIDTLRNEILSSNNASEFADLILDSKDWRERFKFANSLDQICQESTLDFSSVIESLLNDEACDVRKETINQLPALMSLPHINLQTKIWDIIKKLKESDDYQARETALHIIFKLQLDTNSQGCDILNELINDECANVRYVIAKEIPRSHHDLIEKLRGDSDPDVSYIAQQ